MPRLDVERQFHDRLYAEGGLDARNRLVTRLQPVFRDMRDYFLKLQRVSDSTVLEIGCGNALEAVRRFEASGCTYVGVDISSEVIDDNMKKVADCGMKAEFFVDDANCLSAVTGRSFDLIITEATLHHLDIPAALIAVDSVLSAGGVAVYWEPLGTNPVINLFRMLTPHLRSDDEKPLDFKDLSLIRKAFPNSKFTFGCLASLICYPMSYFPFASRRLLASLSKYLSRLDQVLCSIPLVRRFAWIVVIEIRR